MDLKRLRQFVAIAEELHFGKAAIRLGLAQPALSQSLQRLERDLGTALVDRSRHHVSLTRAGRTLLEQGRELLAHAERCEAETRRAGQRSMNRLRIAYSLSALYDAIPRCLQSFRKRWPAVRVELSAHTPEEIGSGLLDGKFDIGMAVYRVATVKRLAVVPIERQAIVVALHKSSSLARKRTLHLRDLDGEACIISNNLREAFPALHEPLVRIFRAAGFKPNVTDQTRDVEAALRLVSRKLGYTFIPEKIGRAFDPSVVVRPVEEFRNELFVDIVVTWVEGSPSPTTRLFLREVQRVLGVHTENPAPYPAPAEQR